MIEEVAVSLGWKIMSWLPGFVLRRYVTKQSLVEKTQIDVRPRNSPVQLLGGDIPEATIWLRIDNKNNFPIELDRLTVELWLAGRTAQFFYLDRVSIPAGKPCEVYVKGLLTEGHIKHMILNRQNPNVSLQVRAEFNSKIHNFSVQTGQLSGIVPSTSGF
jgi:hypothetical protein